MWRVNTWISTLVSEVNLGKYCLLLISYSIVNEDAAVIKTLTKADMIEFYKHYIHPESPARAKIAIHLIAQGTAPSAVAATAASSADTAEKVTKNATTLIEKGISALGFSKTPSSDAPAEGATNGVKKDINGTTPIVITNVRAFKAGLQVSAGPIAVKDMSEFEDLDAKL